VEFPAVPEARAIAALLAGLDDAALIVNGHELCSSADLAALASRPGWLLGAAHESCGLGAWPDVASPTATLAAAHLDRMAIAALRHAPEPADATLAGLFLQVAASGLPATPAAGWLPLVYPWNILEANVAAVRRLEARAIHGHVQEHVHITGPVHIGDGTLIKAGTTIEGPAIIGCNCTIGPSAYVRPDTVIGDDCHLGHAFEIVDSVVFSGTTGKHRSYVGHSVIGSGVNLGGGFISSDYRHDGAEHVTRVGTARVNTGRVKLGAFIGDGVHTGVHTITYPGRKIWPGLTTLPGEIVKVDLAGRC
jgi:hypothetical protein